MSDNSKIKEATMCLDKSIEKLESCLESDLNEGMDSVNVCDLEKLSNSIHYLCEAKDKKVNSIYHETLIEAMQDATYGEDYDEDGVLKGYRGRSARTGRFVHRAYTEREMDMQDGRMGYKPEMYDKGYTEERHGSVNSGYNKGYEDGHNRGYEEGRMKGYEDGRSAGRSSYDRAKRSYEESPREAKPEKLRHLMETLEEELTPMAPQMDANDKAIVKNGLQKMINKFA